MKQTLEILQAKGSTPRLTISPTRVRVKVPKDFTGQHSEMCVKFAKHVAEQFVVINQTWRGIIHFEREGVLYVSTILYTDAQKQPRKYEVTFG